MVCQVVGSVTEPGGCVVIPTPSNVTPHVTSALPHIAQHVGSLPFTGADIGELAIAGIVAVVGGLVIAARRHRVA